ncbi:MAG TPA: AbrB/MazE/SpoVT family DNA-binding domain-containing protein [Caulobacteraceae bacterium]|jgi:AbrB family looped-hinge helix DNA binding protein|nr:AbrB/MazE/SpoVT family DNA-binding domain-containing protein [Caulobacteraceae bacterium]
MDDATTVVSTKGQVILPKAVRESRGWGPGVRLQVIETEDGVLLRQAPAFVATKLDQVFGLLKRDQPALTIEEMDAAVAAEARRRAGR